jgi:hypothetical protein
MDVDRASRLAAPVAPDVRRVGLWSAVAATVCSVVYDVGQLAEWLGWLGSRGGPESGSTPLGLAVLLTPSLLLGSAFLLLTLSIHQIAPREAKLHSHAAVAFATLYTALISVVYFVQLTLVAPRLARGEMDGIEVLRFVPFNSFLYAVDVLGYSFMSLSTLFAARVFAGGGIERVARRFLVANGCLVPFLALQMYFHPLIWGGALWGVTFPGSTAALALIFARLPVRQNEAS